MRNIMSNYPSLFRVRQKFERPRVEDLELAVSEQLRCLPSVEKIGAGQSVAITAGSRGIADIHVVIKTAVGVLKQLGAAPFIVPAMGSHGGGTAEGQRKVIESYGITEEYCGCPIRSNMETIVVSRAREGFDVHFDRCAFEADHVLVCNRVKPHTRFAGEIESGLMKMLLIGLGKHNGAKIYHRAIKDYDFDQIVRSVSGEVLAKCNILGGLAIVENAYDEVAKLEAVSADVFEQREKELLRAARAWMPKLPFPTVDILLIDEIGKNISGSGFDTNIVGRKMVAGDNDRPHIKLIMVRGLTDATHGNACGIGMADFVTQRVMDEIDLEATWINCLTGGEPSIGRIPIYRDTDRDTLDLAINQIGLTDPPDARILWISSTLKLIEVECSAAYLDAARERDDLEILCDPRPFPFDEAGNLSGVSPSHVNV